MSTELIPAEQPRMELALPKEQRAAKFAEADAMLAAREGRGE